jgi:hypothetical protein
MCDSFSDGLRESKHEDIPKNSVKVNKVPTAVRARLMDSARFHQCHSCQRGSLSECVRGGSASERPGKKALLLSWKSLLEFSGGKVIQEQWDIDVGG